MLELRPSCENCDRALPPESTAARICSFECTFCADCVRLLDDVCPNCGGGFERRPVRPAREHRPGAFLGAHPASAARRHRPIDPIAHAAPAAALASVPPETR